MPWNPTFVCLFFWLEYWLCSSIRFLVVTRGLLVSYFLQTFAKNVIQYLVIEVNSTYLKITCLLQHVYIFFCMRFRLTLFYLHLLFTLVHFYKKQGIYQALFPNIANLDLRLFRRSPFYFIPKFPLLCELLIVERR